MATAVKKDALKIYEVVTHALVMRVGKAKDEVLRFGRGAKLELDPNNATTKFFLRHASIVEHNPDKPAPRATPRIMAKAFGAPADPVAPPVIPASPEQVSEAQ